MKNTSYRYWMIYVIAIVAAMGGLLFGFDTGVISGAIPFFQKDFGIDDSMVEVVTSSGLLGAILMFQLRRIGFYFYTAAQILMLFVLPYFAGFNFMVLAGMLFSAIFAVIFIVMYALNLKYMR